MKKFKVTLTRAYSIEIYAKNIKSAKHFAEFYIGDPEDLSIEKERKDKKFKFGEIDMVMNEAMEAKEIFGE